VEAFREAAKLIERFSKFRCRYCKAALGLTDGLRLMIALVEIYSRVPLKCKKCGKVTIWRPPENRPQNVDANRAPAIV